MVVGHCKTCGEEIRSRRSDKNSAQRNFLAAVRRHYKKKHKNTIGQRISRGLRSSNENPTDRNFIIAIQEGARAALKAYGKMTERQFQRTKRTMRALKPILPPETVLVWEFIEAVHDERMAK